MVLEAGFPAMDGFPEQELRMRLIEDNIDLTAYLEDSKETSMIKSALNWLAEVIDHFHGKSENKYGPRLPWLKTRDDFEFRRGEVTIWAGINSHGKSMLLSQVALSLMVQGERVCLASLEMKPFRTMARMARQARGEDEPSIAFLNYFHQWTDGKLWIYDRTGSVKPQTMLALIRYAKDKFDIDHFIIDNLTKVIAGEDNYNGQKDFADSLATLAADLDIHIHIVMHVRKGKDENEIPNKMSIKGAGSLTDIVDNIFIVFRNKMKERQIREGNNAMTPDPDALLILEKQRNGETEATYQLWFHGPSFQYVENRNDQPTVYRIFNQQHYSTGASSDPTF